ncbi:MAG TPA: hypothetical protein DCS97_14930 [Planctomycetes bacterium]|nr:hypothetical protein [Planctomycetota bacterium]
MILNVVADARYLREKARADYLDAERGLFERWGPTAGRNLTDDDRRLLAVQGKAVGWKRLTKIAHIATAQTIRRWHRKLIGITRAKSGGKPQTSPVVEALVVKLAVENSYGNDSWGRRRIAGALLALGHDLDAGTVRNILRRHGIPPAPNRGRGRDNDLQMAVETLADIAIDFAQTVVIDAGRICRLYILLAIHIQTREAVLVGITEHPTEAWMLQCARNLTMAEVGFLQLTKAASIQMDHDAIFTAHFRKTLADAGLDVRFTPRRQPWKNGHIERFIQTLKNLVLHKFIFLGENAVREAISIGIRHYNQERPHQSLDNRPPKPPSGSAPDLSKPIIRIDRLDGAIHHYVRAA